MENRSGPGGRCGGDSGRRHRRGVPRRWRCSMRIPKARTPRRWAQTKPTTLRDFVDACRQRASRRIWPATTRGKDAAPSTGAPRGTTGTRSVRSIRKRIEGALRLGQDRRAASARRCYRGLRRVDQHFKLTMTASNIGANGSNAERGASREQRDESHRTHPRKPAGTKSAGIGNLTRESLGCGSYPAVVSSHSRRVKPQSARHGARPRSSSPTWPVYSPGRTPGTTLLAGAVVQRRHAQIHRQAGFGREALQRADLTRQLRTAGGTKARKGVDPSGDFRVRRSSAMAASG